MIGYEEAKYAYLRDEIQAREGTGFEFSDIFRYAGATLVDTLVTAADSLTFGLFDNDDIEGNGTSQALHWMNEDLGDYYDKNRESVALGSFIGGMVLPGLGAAKAMKWAREGSTLFKPLSNSFKRTAEWEVKALEGLKAESVKSAAWKDALGEVKWGTIRQGVAEGMIYEATYAMFNNQHSYLDNEYSIGDYMIGATLGSLVGPFRWMGKKKDLYEKGLAIAAEEGKGQVLGVLYPSITGGDLLSAFSHQHGAIRKAQADNPNRSIGGQDFAEANRRTTINNMSTQIDEMSTPELLALNSDTKARVAEEARDLDYFSLDPREMIAQMNIANPEAFRGVYAKRGFGLFSEKNAAEAGLDSVVRYEDEIGYITDTGYSARQTLFVSPKKGTKAKTEAELRAIQNDLGIKISGSPRGGVTVNFTQPVTVKHKQWAGDFLNLPSYRESPVTVTGEIGKLKINKKKQYDILGLKALELAPVGKFNTYQEHLEVLDHIVDSGRLVIDPWLPGNPISLIHAVSAQGAAQTAKLKEAFNKRATILDAVKYDTTKQSVAESDFFWIQGAQAIDNEKRMRVGYNLGAAEEGMSKLQRLVQRFGEFPEMVTIGGQKLVDKNSALNYIWDWKQAEVKKLTDAGGSSLQIAKKVNLPPDVVEAMQHAKFTLSRAENRISMYTGRADKYLENRNIMVEGKGASAAAQDEITAVATLDRQAQQMFHESVVGNALNAAALGGDEIKRLYTQVIDDPRMKTIREHLPQLIANLESKNTLITSTDHMLRFLGPVRDHITTVANDLVAISNDLHSRHMEALAGPLNALLHNKVAATQFAQVQQRLEGLSSAQSRRLNIDVGEDGVARIGLGDETADSPQTYLTFRNSDQEIILSPENADFWEAYLPIRMEKQEINNAISTLLGREKSNGLPLWLPNHNLTDSFLGFKVSKKDPKDIQMIAANTADDLERELAAGKRDYMDTHNFYARSDQDLGEYNRMLQYAELNDIQPVNTFSARGGIEKGLLSGDVAIQNFISNLRSDTMHKMRLMTKLSLPDVFDPLDEATRYSSREADASKGFFAQKIQRPVTISETVKKVILNESRLGTSPGVDWANNYITLRANQLIHQTQKLYHKVKGDEGPKAWEELSEAMRKEGMVVPWETYADYQRTLATRKNRDLAQHYLSKNQSALVLLNLRLLDFSHAAVTTLSAPVILAGEAQHVLGKGPFATTELLMNAYKFARSKSDESARVMGIGKERKYTESIVAEADKIMEDLPRYDMAKINKRYESFKTLMTKPSDWSEGATRELAYATGYLLAKGQYPTAGEKLWVSNAGAFVARTMGNYASRQKPTMFQGTFGQTIGLYQTFMLTMGQNLYRYAEAADHKAIAQLMLGQASMFGIESLPFFKEFNQVAGEYASDDNIDISTTVYNVFGNNDEQSRSRAEFILYGLPSAAFNTAIYTRASLEPRTPISISSPSGLAYRPAIFDAYINAADISFKTVKNMYSSLSTGGGIADMKNAALQGMAAQHLWRPLARYAELGLGRSYDQKGEIVDLNTLDEPFAIGARVFGARPLQEQALRNMRFRASYYNGVDRDRRQKVIQQVRRVISNGEDPDQIGTLMDEYIYDHNGSHKGWSTILKTVYSSLDTDSAIRLAEYAQKQPAIADIAASYSQ